MFYYINTNEIAGDLSQENMISFHVKITCYLHMWKDGRCYGYIKNRIFRSETEIVCNSLLGDTKFLFLFWQLFHEWAKHSPLMKYFSTLNEKFRISARPCNILEVCSTETPEKFCLFRIWFRARLLNSITLIQRLLKQITRGTEGNFVRHAASMEIRHILSWWMSSCN